MNTPVVDDLRDSPDTDSEKLLLFPGKIVRKNGALAFRGPLIQFFLTVVMGKAVWRQNVSEQEEVCMGVRAKYIRVDDGAANDDVYVFGKAENNSLDGLNGHVKVRLGKDGIVIKAGNGIEYNDGDSVRLQFSRNNAVLFRCSLDRVDRETMPLALPPV